MPGFMQIGQVLVLTGRPSKVSIKFSRIFLSLLIMAKMPGFLRKRPAFSSKTAYTAARCGSKYFNLDYKPLHESWPCNETSLSRNIL